MQDRYRRPDEILLRRTAGPYIGSFAKDLLKWSPRTALKDGLTTTIAYFNELLKAEGVRVLADPGPSSGALARS